jgi:hypothetical protein
LHFSIWASEDFQKKWSLPAVLFWQISTTICICLLISFFFEFFWSWNFWGSCYSNFCDNMCWIWVETEPKSGSTILHTLMLLMRIVWSSVWRKFSSVGKGEWWDEMKYGKKLKLGDAHVTPINIQGVQTSKLRDARGTPFFINKNIRSSFKTLFLLLHILCVFLGASLFLLSVFFYFVCCNKWLDHIIFALERDTLHFHCLEHSSFHSYRSTSVLFF